MVLQASTVHRAMLTVEFIKGTSDTTAGSYAVTVTTAGERGTISAGTNQTTTLAADEVLTINDVSITLTAGLNQNQVVDRINEFTSQTGVIADIDSGATRLYTQDFGSDAQVKVVSNLASATNSSGFGQSLVTDDGIDIEGTIDGAAFNGKGDVLTADSGVAKGLVRSDCRHWC